LERGICGDHDDDSWTMADHITHVHMFVL